MSQVRKVQLQGTRLETSSGRNSISVVIRFYYGLKKLNEAKNPNAESFQYWDFKSYKGN
jgi:hypothetical protein